MRLEMVWWLRKASITTGTADVGIRMIAGFTNNINR